MTINHQYKIKIHLHIKIYQEELYTFPVDKMVVVITYYETPQNKNKYERGKERRWRKEMITYYTLQ